MARETVEQLGSVDVLVNNAGVIAVGLVADFSEEQWDRVMAVKRQRTVSFKVRDHRTGEVHLPHERMAVLRTTKNLGRTLFKIRWETGGESSRLLKDLKSRPQLRSAGSEQCLIAAGTLPS
jgi:hypothetical protein